MKVIFWVLGGIFLIVGLTTVFGGGWGDGPGGAVSAADDGAHVLDALLQFGAAAGFFILASQKKKAPNKSKRPE